MFSSLWWSAILTATQALQYDIDYVGYNLNENETAVNALDYYGKWENHTYHPSPVNWRFPVYSIFLDKFVNGDPSNDNFNGTQYEHDPMQTQLRHGGDLQGLIDGLDYIQGMGVKGIYVAGTPFVNKPWGADGYSPLDLTLLDGHFGDIQKYRDMITEVHDRGMYVIADNTMATLGNLNGFVGYLNTTATFSLREHEVVPIDPMFQYHDFHPGNDYNETCTYPRFWLDSGYLIPEETQAGFQGCYNSDFDQYGDTEAFGVHPDWQRQLSRFASVQDRLREWVPSVREKIEHFSCLQIRMLDIDGFRLDKATQITVDALGDYGNAIRECARSVGKENFFITGEIVAGNTFGSIYLGRGRQPDMLPEDLESAVTATNASNSSTWIRDEGLNAVDSAAFHYSIYRSLTRFLGMDGILASGYDTPLNWVDAWNEILMTNDLINPNTNVFDARHMFGTANQDVFRWPSIKNGTAKQLLGSFITTLHMPGIPLILWGEEQGFYVLDNTATNYLFGRQAMSTATAWETHGCYELGAESFTDFPVEAALHGCNDPWNSLDHRDPSSPIRNIMKGMYQMRNQFPVLNDGLFLQSLSNQTHYIQLPGSVLSDGTRVPTEVGLWSTYRGRFSFQDFTGQGQQNQSVWLVYQNQNTTINYQFNCSDNATALIAPFDSGTTVKNLFYPFDEVTLEDGPIRLGIEGSTELNGCLNDMELPAWGFKAYVPNDTWVGASPMVTKFSPGHDYRLVATAGLGLNESVAIELEFSAEMDCAALVTGIEITSTTESNMTANLDVSTVQCETIVGTIVDNMVGYIPSAWKFSANLTNVWDGVHSVTIRNLSNIAGNQSTGANDTFIFRIGQLDNPIVFPRQANYSDGVLHQDSNGSLYVSHKAAGADSWRYALDWTTYSEWMPYIGGNSTLKPKEWMGTKLQAWEGEHVILQYYNKLSGSSDYLQHGDLNYSTPRRLPHLFAEGPFNQYGFDAGLGNEFTHCEDGIWRWNFITEWPGILQLNTWGINPDGYPDHSNVFGDADSDSILDRIPPNALAPAIINVTAPPPVPYLGWMVEVNDATLRFSIIPIGNHWIQITIFIVMCVVPTITAIISVCAFMGFFYDVKFNQIGVSERQTFPPVVGIRYITKHLASLRCDGAKVKENGRENDAPLPLTISANDVSNEEPADSLTRRNVLIATIEYDIEDWNIKIKIGGLGVMAQLMGKNLEHHNLIWVVPCVGGIEYPRDEPAEPMYITILEQTYEVEVQYHKLHDITYVLLDAPVFRAQSKSEPYPPRMDDLESAVYYSSWNQCIALAMQRFPVDLYHINDYHGTAALLYLLPKTIPACLSLHNAEFQGLWPLRTAKEFNEVCRVFNLTPAIVKKYVQYGDVFNLLHAGSSYLRIHQKGFGAVGVSKKYGTRSHARYPIFWGLSKIGQLPNPDPTDTADWSGKQDEEIVVVDEEFETSRAELRRQLQEWAGLDQNPDADLLVFVGRWSMQKGIDLIADIMPAVLEENPKVQLLTIGPVVDLYGKFAALKLDVMMEKYKGRVYSKPEFTALPPFVFSGAEFALIPSRDEPFGLVAVEFGRKGALGIGARVGGLGQMPGWWFTVESTTTSHLLRQFKAAVNEALASKTEFPVARWITQLESLQSTAIQIHDKENDDISSVLNTFRRSVGLFIDGSQPNSGISSALQSSSQSKHTSRCPTPPPLPLELPRPSMTMELPTWLLYEPAKTNLVRCAIDAGGRFEISNEDLDTPLDDGLHQQGGLLTTTSQPSLASRSTFSSRHGAIHAGCVTSSKDENTKGTNLTPPLTPNSSFLRTGPFEDSVEQLSLPGIPRDNLSRFSSTLSINSIVGTKTDFALQNVDPDFTDSRGEYYNAFKKSLDNLNGDNSENQLCIEDFLVHSERQWHKHFKAAKLGLSYNSPSRASIFGEKLPPPSVNSALASITMLSESDKKSDVDQWPLGNNYEPPTGLKLFMQYRVGDWPVYSLFLAFGQIIAANSYQITLLSGGIGQTAEKLYITASIYLATSAMWWIIFRSFKSVYVLSIPFLFYSLALLLLGVAPYARTIDGRGWVQNVATGMYATGSSSGSIFFALNFGDEGGAPIHSWVYRSCIIQGTQQIYVCALWAWGDYISSQSALGNLNLSIITTSSTTMTAIAMPIAALFFVISMLVFFGLPKYYHQAPGQISSFYAAVFRRKTVLWFFVVVLLQNYFLSSSTGRNWKYLWSSNHAAVWQIICLVILFFVLIWSSVLFNFGRLSKDHSWILPLFAVGLGAPRWAQILWSCSGIGAYLPWTKSAVASALISRSLWLWLGMLDAIQGVGFGMILLQTVTRLHIAYTLIAGQVLGSMATMVARATAPNRTGPGDLFPDFSTGIFPGAWKAWFWIGLAAQLIVNIGFFRFFRKEQLSKP